MNLKQPELTNRALANLRNPEIFYWTYCPDLYLLHRDSEIELKRGGIGSFILARRGLRG